jgi:glycosyltransferase involved in cell wall biosynthesis
MLADDAEHGENDADPSRLILHPIEAPTRLLLDATLVLHHGLISAVGIVRVEHYVYEYLAREAAPAAALDFVTWDHAHSVYRAITAQERLSLASIIFRTEAVAAPVPPEPCPPEPEDADADLAVPTVMPVVAAAVEAPPRLTARSNAADRDAALAAIARRYLPVDPQHAAPRRIATRAVRVAALMSARLAHRLVAAVVHTTDWLRPKPAPLPEPLLELLAEPVPEPEPEPEPEPPPPNPFRRGDVLVSLANAWDFMDYAYLASLKPKLGVRFVCILYDVCGVELPYVTPGPTHQYHRHWVEIGHIAERLISISQFSADSYRRLIGEPNNIDVPIHVAGLPNFLHARAAEIGELAVPDLIDRDFVVFCSTIEIRKNHILLINLWEELRQRLPNGRLPILVFVGKWGWYADNVRMIAERNFRLRPHLRILTDISDAELIWLYRHASFTVFPALSEGFGLAAAESLSFGTPVITSHCPALIEATEGLMPALHPQDFIGWRQAIEHIILDDDALAALRSKAKQFRGPAYQAFAELVLHSAQGGAMPSERSKPMAPQSLPA